EEERGVARGRGGGRPNGEAAAPPGPQAHQEKDNQFPVVPDAARDPPAAVIAGDERAQADEGGVPERGLARVAGQQVEPDGADSDDAGERENAGPLVVDQVRDDQVQGDERDQSNALGRARAQAQVVGVAADHRAVRSCHQTLRTSRVPNSPNGRTSKMMSMIRYGTMSPNSAPRAGKRSGMYPFAITSATPIVSPPTPAPPGESRPPRMIAGHARNAIKARLTRR